MTKETSLPFLESRRLGIYALLSVYIGSGKTTGKRKLKHSLKKRCTRELWERDRSHHQTPLTKCGYCLVPRRLSLDENVRAKECGKEPSVPFPWSLAVHHQSLAFRARLYDAKNEAPEEEACAATYSWTDACHPVFD